ncbi:MAG: transcription termination/antitermination protein NusG [Limisphaerales bacterium]
MQSTPSDEITAWFCAASQRKHEYIAAAQLADQYKVKVFAPRIRFRRTSGSGPRWATEALFPGYFFAKIGLSALRRVHHAPQVRGIVHFGSSWPTIPERTIEELEKVVGGTEIYSISPQVSAGDSVKIIEGTFHGFEALVTRVMPTRERVAVLLDFLGRQTVVELNAGAVINSAEERTLLFRIGPNEGLVAEDPQVPSRR